MAFMRETERSLAVYMCIAGAFGLLTNLAELGRIFHLASQPQGLSLSGEIFRAVTYVLLAVSVAFVLVGVSLKQTMLSAPRLIPWLLITTVFMHALLAVIFRTPEVAAFAIGVAVLSAYLYFQANNIARELRDKVKSMRSNSNSESPGVLDEELSVSEGGQKETVDAAIISGRGSQNKEKFRFSNSRAAPLFLTMVVAGIAGIFVIDLLNAKPESGSGTHVSKPTSGQRASDRQYQDAGVERHEVSTNELAESHGVRTEVAPLINTVLALLPDQQNKGDSVDVVKVLGAQNAFYEGAAWPPETEIHGFSMPHAFEHANYLGMLKLSGVPENSFASWWIFAAPDAKDANTAVAIEFVQVAAGPYIDVATELRRAGVSATGAICNYLSSGNSDAYYRIVAPGKRPAILVVSETSGSRGAEINFSLVFRNMSLGDVRGDDGDYVDGHYMIGECADLLRDKYPSRVPGQ